MICGDEVKFAGVMTTTDVGCQCGETLVSDSRGKWSMFVTLIGSRLTGSTDLLIGCWMLHFRVTPLRLTDLQSNIMPLARPSEELVTQSKT